MKKNYVAPELNKIVFDVQDIITHSLAGDGGDNEVTVPDGWLDFGFTYDGRNIGNTGLNK